MPDATPETRASFAHDIMSELRLLPAAELEAIIGQCGEMWTTLQTSLPTTWLDETTYNTLTQAVRTELGEVEMRALFRRVGRKLSKSPMFAATVDALIRISGASPHVLLRVIPRVIGSASRNSGKMTYEKIGERQAYLRLTGFPSSSFASGNTAIQVAGSLEGTIEALNGVPEIRIEDLDVEGGSLTVNISWT